ncbi:MAG: NADH-quinone oxidoreductase subunit H [Bacteroidales bacterium]|nr:NADH-quinone oxidoreductase subunit H [Bacteroidales bacterium]
MIKELFYFLIFPGMIFSVIIGGILSWSDRKITAMVQFRKGPPFLQPFYDLGKLFYKETILPKHGAKFTFLAAPVFALFAAVMANVFILLPSIFPGSGFRGDLIVVFYLLTIPSLTYIIGSLASGNPLGALGASREMKLIISYELAFILAITALVIKSGMHLSISEVLAAQQDGGAFIGSISGVLLFIVVLFVIQAKLALVPFDMSEAEAEIAHGVFIEYSGSAYAIIKMARYIMLFTLPAMMVTFLMGGFNLSGVGILWSVLKLVLVLLLITLIRNTNPRVRIDQAMRFFFIWMNLLAIVAIGLSLINL